MEGRVAELVVGELEGASSWPDRFLAVDASVLSVAPGMSCIREHNDMHQ